MGVASRIFAVMTVARVITAMLRLRDAGVSAWFGIAYGPPLLLVKPKRRELRPGGLRGGGPDRSSPAGTVPLQGVAWHDAPPVDRRRGGDRPEKAFGRRKAVPGSS